MGGIITKAGEWTEVVTGSSPGSPESDDPHRITNNEVARRRILRVDPRSISDDVNRTPIQVDRSPNESTPKATAPAFLDPRSPSNELPRTPIILSHAKPPVNLEDSFENCQQQTVAPAPSRGAISADLKGIEEKVETLKIVDDESNHESMKEEGEITHDCTDEEADEEEKLVLRQLTPEPEQSAKLKQLEKDESKEEGEITDDSDEEDENIENLLENKTPVTIRSKSTLESDCRSPLLIENSEPVFEKALSSELAVMAAKNNAPRHRKPLGDKNDDSLVI